MLRCAEQRDDGGSVFLTEYGTPFCVLRSEDLRLARIARADRAAQTGRRIARQRHKTFRNGAKWCCSLIDTSEPYEA